MQSDVRAASADGHGRNTTRTALGRPGDRTAAGLEIVSVVPRLQKLLARSQSPLIEGFALCGSDVEVDRTNLVCGYEDGTSYGARIVDVSVVLIANQCFYRRNPQRHWPVHRMGWRYAGACRQPDPERRPSRLAVGPIE